MIDPKLLSDIFWGGFAVFATFLAFYTIYLDEIIDWVHKKRRKKSKHARR